MGTILVNANQSSESGSICINTDGIVGNSDDESQPKIFIRDFAEIAEKDSDDENKDVVVILDIDENRVEMMPRKTPGPTARKRTTPRRKGTQNNLRKSPIFSAKSKSRILLSDVATNDDSAATLELSVDEDGYDLPSGLMLDQDRAKEGFVTVKKTLLQLKTLQKFSKDDGNNTRVNTPSPSPRRSPFILPNISTSTLNPTVYGSVVEIIPIPMDESLRPIVVHETNPSHVCVSSAIPEKSILQRPQLTSPTIQSVETLRSPQTAVFHQSRNIFPSSVQLRIENGRINPTPPPHSRNVNQIGNLSRLPSGVLTRPVLPVSSQHPPPRRPNVLRAPSKLINSRSSSLPHGFAIQPGVHVSMPRQPMQSQVQQLHPRGHPTPGNLRIDRPAPLVTQQVNRPSVVGSIRAPSVVGSIRAHSVVGSIRAPSVVGSIRAPSVVGSIRAHSVVGSIRAPSVVGSIRAHSVVGSIRAPSVVGSIRAPSVVGSIRAPSVVGSINASSVVGSIRAPSVVGSINAPSAVGSIRAPSIGAPAPASVSCSDASSSKVTAGNQKPFPETKEVEDVIDSRTFPSLVVGVKPSLRQVVRKAFLAQERSYLDFEVKSALANSPKKFVEWLMRHELLKIYHFCTHGATKTQYKFGMYSDSTQDPYSGGYVWIVNCCPKKLLSVFKGTIFEDRKYPPGYLFKLIYHWCCQTSTPNILQWVQVSNVFLKNFFIVLRTVCIAWLHEYCPILGNNEGYVELGLITLGGCVETTQGVKRVSVEILGVLDPSVKMIRFKVINSFQEFVKNAKGKTPTIVEEQNARMFQILWAVSHWVNKNSILVTDAHLEKIGFKRVLHTGELIENTTLTNSAVMNYLREVIPKMFSTTLSLLSKSSIQQFLDELSWREIHNSSARSSYHSMLAHIAQLTQRDLGESLLSHSLKISRSPLLDWSWTKQAQRSPVTFPISIRNQPGIKDCILSIKTGQRTANKALKVQNKTPVVHNKPEKRKISEEPEPDVEYYYNSQYLKSTIKDLSLKIYYYGRKPSVEPKPALALFSGNVQCPMCSLTFLTNKEIIKHLIVHITGMKRGSENSLCNYCLEEVGVGATMKEHVRNTHKLEGAKYNCRICEKKFPTEQQLTIHMWSFHVEVECPYSCGLCEYACSFHCEIIDHFNQCHAGVNHVLCPHCLKVLFVKSLPHVQAVVTHFQGHQTKRTLKKCNRCVLSFMTDADVRLHNAFHASCKTGTANWIHYELEETEENIMMATPPPQITPDTVEQLLPFKKSKPTEKKKITENANSSLNASFSVPVDINEKFGVVTFKIEIPVVEKGRAVCVECNTDITTPNHFVGHLTCFKCRFATSCKIAMERHQEQHESGSSRRKPEKRTKPVKMLKNYLLCKCGFSSMNPFKVAHHLADCENKTVQPTKPTTTEVSEPVSTIKETTLIPKIEDWDLPTIVSVGSLLPTISSPSFPSIPTLELPSE